ncbi:MAG: energy transducer TonB [Deltaproteobacteria bacterium]|nr:energy transducer TonB [Deltaproteobacteria bacterium]
MTAEQRQNRITTAFILLSLLLHLLLMLVPKEKLFPTDKTPEPVYVEIRPPQEQERMLDIPIRKELEKPREKPAKRLAEKDQVVEKEMAPEGNDIVDIPKMVRAPQPVQKPTPTPPAKPKPRTETPPEKTERPDDALKKTEPTPAAPVTPEGWKPKPEKKQAPQLPDLKTLTQISPGALAQIESDWRRKYRDDIAKSDTVWMDTQQDLLISFMRRFRTNIYNVWNYPDYAVRRNQKGTCLVRITVDRQGNVTDVLLLESSGYQVLDNETIRAVRAGATYGPLPRAYPNKDLKIIAFFQYSTGGNVKRSSRRRPGSIY